MEKPTFSFCILTGKQFRTVSSAIHVFIAQVHSHPHPDGTEFGADIFITERKIARSDKITVFFFIVAEDLTANSASQFFQKNLTVHFCEKTTPITKVFGNSNKGADIRISAAFQSVFRLMVDSVFLQSKLSSWDSKICTDVPAIERKPVLSTGLISVANSFPFFISRK